MKNLLANMKKINYKIAISITMSIIIPIIILVISCFTESSLHYITGLSIIICSMIPLFVVFETKSSKISFLIMIATLSSLAIVGRLAFIAIPQFKPMAAIIIISAICLGPESGFVVGALSTLISNFFFGQGPWTPWQMFCFGMIGFVAGFIFKNKKWRDSLIAVSTYGFLSTFIIYGGIMNIASIFMYYDNPTWEMITTYYLASLPSDLIHSVSTFVFLLLLAKPLIKQIDRINCKYNGV